MDLDSTDLEVSMRKGRGMFSPRGTIVVSLNWNLKMLPGLHWVSLGGRKRGMSRIIVLVRVIEPENGMEIQLCSNRREW